MEKKILKKKIRDVIIMRNFLEDIAEGKYKNNVFLTHTKFDLAQKLMTLARVTHKDLPYYLAIRAI